MEKQIKNQIMGDSLRKQPGGGSDDKDDKRKPREIPSDPEEQEKYLEELIGKGPKKPGEHEEAHDVLAKGGIEKLAEHPSKAEIVEIRPMRMGSDFGIILKVGDKQEIINVSFDKKIIYSGGVVQRLGNEILAFKGSGTKDKDKRLSEIETVLNTEEGKEILEEAISKVLNIPVALTVPEGKLPPIPEELEIEPPQISNEDSDYLRGYEEKQNILLVKKKKSEILPPSFMKMNQSVFEMNAESPESVKSFDKEILKFKESQEDYIENTKQFLSEKNGLRKLFALDNKAHKLYHLHRYRPFRMKIGKLAEKSTQIQELDSTVVKVLKISKAIMYMEEKMKNLEDYFSENYMKLVKVGDEGQLAITIGLLVDARTVDDVHNIIDKYDLKEKVPEEFRELAEIVNYLDEGSKSVTGIARAA